MAVEVTMLISGIFGAKVARGASTILSPPHMRNLELLCKTLSTSLAVSYVISAGTAICHQSLSIDSAGSAQRTNITVNLDSLTSPRMNCSRDCAVVSQPAVQQLFSVEW